MEKELDIDEELTETGNVGKKSREKKNRMTAVVGIAIIIAVCAAFSVYTYSSKYLKTDNAKVTADIYPISSKTEGKLLKFDAYVGKYVESGTILGRVEGGQYIKAPSDGEFIEVDAARGDYILTTDVMGYIADVDNMYIGANIEETDITKIKQGQSVIVTLDAYGSKKFDGVVTKVKNITDSALSGQTTSYSTSGTYTKTTQLIPVEIELIDPGIYLDEIIGTNATVKIRIKN
jgi:multidrug resistance efflux pump